MNMVLMQKGVCVGAMLFLRHNQNNFIMYKQAQTAGTNPELEKQGLLDDLGWPELAGRRPADTLLVSSGALATTSRRQFPKIAFDFAVIKYKF